MYRIVGVSPSYTYTYQLVRSRAIVNLTIKLVRCLNPIIERTRTYNTANPKQCESSVYRL